MRRAFQASGWPTLFDDGLEKVRKGVTTIDEILRATEVSGEIGDDVVKS
jgi:type II secretory ATPase GspE/PulE/Tfp pilus assembly ATPase PilB-like protein